MKNFEGDRYDDFNRFKRNFAAVEPLTVIDPRQWQDKPLPKREWMVEGFVPHRAVTLFSGDGGSGKTQTAIQLMVAAALGLDWFGKAVRPCRSLLYTAEDETDELHRRLAATVNKTGHRLADLGDIRLIAMAGLDAVLAKPNGLGQTVETILFEKLKVEVEKFRPRLVVIGPAADVFAGNEIDRAQVRHFVQKLSALALDYDCTVMLLSHPSLTGLSSGTGTSGSTAWSNSVRSRLYLKAVKDDPDRRVLTVMKTNYGRTGQEIAIRWADGVYVVDTGDDPAVTNLMNKRVDEVFLSLLGTFTNQGQNLTVKTGAAYAPAKMASHPMAKGIDKKQLAASMQRLLDAGRIRLITEGSPSRQRTRLVPVH